MNIQHHIKTLLYRQDCVMVKGLGGFVTQQQSAKLENGYFLPPEKTLSFNQNLDKSDGLLENHVAKAEKVSYQIAQQKIQAFSQKIYDVLEEEQKIYLKDLGSFKLLDGLKLVFEPETSNQFLIESYGLPKFKLEQLELEQKSNETPLVAIPKDNDNVTKEKTTPSYWKYAAVGLIAIGLSGFVGAQIYQSNIQDYNLVEQEKADKIIDNTIQQSSFIISDPLEPISIEIQSPKPGKYHIVGGAFRVKANADKKIATLKAKGYNARYIGKNSYDLHQVVYESFTSKEQALSALKQIKASENPSAWLFVKEL